MWVSLKNDPDKYQFIAINPLKQLRKLSIPGLWIFGEKDIQVPVNLSMELLDSLKSFNPLYEYKLYPDLDHNTVFSKSTKPIEEAIKWLKNIHVSVKK